MPGEPRIGVVIPVFNCAECLGPLCDRLASMFRSIGMENYQVVLVDDRSTDASWASVRQLAASDEHIEAIRLSRNFGQHAAITAGLARACGEWVVVMDCDLQDPPEVIPELYAKALSGFDMVFARRRRTGDSLVRRVAAAAYFKIINALLDADIDRDLGTLSIISKKVVRSFLEIRDKDRQYLNILFWLGYAHTSIEFEHQPRFAGTSSYSIARLLRHGYEGVFFQTTTLLRWIVYFGFLVALSGAALAGYLVLAYLNNARPPEGWTSLAVLILLVGGFIIVSTGVTGLYIGMIFKQVKDRPVYVIDEIVTRSGSGEAR